MVTELIVTVRVRRRWLWALRASLALASWALVLVDWIASHPSVEVK